MKWPLVELKWQDPKKIIRKEYITKITEFEIDSEKCKLCQQCVKVCPKEALSMPKFIKGKKMAKKDRIPEMKDPEKCVFCGLCMVFCPFEAISLKSDGELINKSDLAYVKAGKLPELVKVKTGKVEINPPDFKSRLWDKLVERSSIKIAVSEK